MTNPVDYKIFLINYTRTISDVGACAIAADNEEHARERLAKMVGDSMLNFEITDCVDVSSSEYMQKQMEAERKAQEEYDNFMKEMMGGPASEEPQEPTLN